MTLIISLFLIKMYAINTWFDVLPIELNNIIWKMVNAGVLTDIKKFGAIKDNFQKQVYPLFTLYTNHNIDFKPRDRIPNEYRVFNAMNSLNERLIQKINSIIGPHEYYIMTQSPYQIKHSCGFLNDNCVPTCGKLFDLCRPYTYEWTNIGRHTHARKYTKSLYSGSVVKYHFPYIQELSCDELFDMCINNGIEPVYKTKNDLIRILLTL